MNRSIEPAFPGRSEETDMWIDGTERRTANDIQEGASGSAWPGMTIREYFAAMAMQGMIASGKWAAFMREDMAKDAVKYADALIVELAKQNQ